MKLARNLIVNLPSEDNNHQDVASIMTTMDQETQQATRGRSLLQTQTQPNTAGSAPNTISQFATSEITNKSLQFNIHPESNSRTASQRASTSTPRFIAAAPKTFEEHCTGLPNELKNMIIKNLLPGPRTLRYYDESLGTYRPKHAAYCLRKNAEITLLHGISKAWSEFIDHHYVKVYLNYYRPSRAVDPFLWVNAEKDTVLCDIDLYIYRTTKWPLLFTGLKHIALSGDYIKRYDFFSLLCMSTLKQIAKKLKSLTWVKYLEVYDDEDDSEYDTSWDETADLQIVKVDTCDFGAACPRDLTVLGFPDEAEDMQREYKRYQSMQSEWKGVDFRFGILAKRESASSPWRLLYVQYMHYFCGEHPPHNIQVIGGQNSEKDEKELFARDDSEYHAHAEPVTLDFARLTLQSCRALAASPQDICEKCGVQDLEWVLSSSQE